MLSIILMVPLLATLRYVPITMATSFPYKQIVLPFDTGWETFGTDPDPTGTTQCQCNQVYSLSDAGKLTGLGPGNTPQLTLANYQTLPYNFPGAYGYATTGLTNQWYLRAMGQFAGAPVNGVLRLFDSMSDSDGNTPFALMSNTSISIWYFHVNNGQNDAGRHIMIDGQLFNPYLPAGQQYSTLGSFQDQSGKYVVDQHGVRLDAASRNDSMGTWQHAAFDLSLIYDTDPYPNHWFVTMLTVRFDNNVPNDYPTGNATTLFDDFRITYGTVAGTTYSVNIWNNGYEGKLVVAATAEAWGLEKSPVGQNLVTYRLGISAFSNASSDSTNWQGQYLVAFPHLLDATFFGSDASFIAASTSAYTAPTGVNLTSMTSSKPDSTGDFLLSQALLGGETFLDLIAGPFGYPLTLFEAWYSEIGLAQSYFLLSETVYPQEGLVYYHWPAALQSKMIWESTTKYGNVPNAMHGVAFAQVTETSPPGFTRTVNASVDFANVDNGNRTIDIGPSVWVPLTLNWPGYYNPENPHPVTPSAPVGPTSGYVGDAYQFSQYTTDPNNEILLYQFDWGDGTISTTDWFGSGYGAAAMHRYASPGYYSVKVIAENAQGLWSDWSDPSTIHITLPAPPCSASASPTQGRLYVTVHFSVTCQAGVSSASWTFGDGETSPEINPIHTYYWLPQHGTTQRFEPSVIVYDGTGYPYEPSVPKIYLICRTGCPQYPAP